MVPSILGIVLQEGCSRQWADKGADGVAEVDTVQVGSAILSLPDVEDETIAAWKYDHSSTTLVLLATCFFQPLHTRFKSSKHDPLDEGECKEPIDVSTVWVQDNDAAQCQCKCKHEHVLQVRILVHKVAS